MPFQRIDSALRVCEQHIQSLGELDNLQQEVETYIVAGLVVLMVSEYEDHLENLFFRRADTCGDAFASNYIKIALNQKFRSPDLSKINQTLKNFDESCLLSFKQEIENSPSHAAWDSLMKARHAVVHKKGQLNLTFRELKNSYELTKEVIRNVETALGI